MINGINYPKFKEEFLSTDIGKKLQVDFEEITCDRRVYPSILFMKNKYRSTCRELLGSNDLVISNPKKTISIISFYYLNFLLEKNPKEIYDIGCGWNIWKRYIPNIIGVDSNSKHADILVRYDYDYIKSNTRKHEAAFSINMDAGLNGICTFETLIDQIYEFSTIIKPGGRGYVSFSCLGLYYFTPTDWYEKNNCTELTVGEVLKERLLNLPLNILVLDCEFDIFRNFAGHDGELRVVFEVPNVGI